MTAGKPSLERKLVLKIYKIFYLHMIDFLIRKFRISNEVSSFYAIKLKLFLL